MARLVSVHEVGKRRVYDLTVDDTHCFVANGVVVHNCMRISQVLGGFTPIESNHLRRAIGKKKLKDLAAMKEKFIKGAQVRVDAGEIGAEEVEKVWDMLLSFAGYGFNLAHAATYSAVSAAELWLRYRYKEEFLTALLCNTKATAKKRGELVLANLIYYCRKKGVEVLPPSVNESTANFHIETVRGERQIRYSLGHIKNVGACAEQIEALAPFENFEDFFNRVERRRVNKRVVMSLLAANTFACWGDRNEMLAQYVDLRNPPKKDMLAPKHKRIAKLERKLNGLPDGSERDEALGMMAELQEDVDARTEKANAIEDENRRKTALAKLDAKHRRITKLKKLIYGLTSEEERLEVRESLEAERQKLRAAEERQRNKEDAIAEEKKPRPLHEWETQETELLGVCLSRPILRRQYGAMIRENGWCTTSNVKDQKHAHVFGRIDSMVPKVSRAGNDMYIVALNDDVETLDFFVFKTAITVFCDQFSKGDLVAVPLDSFKDSESGMRFFDTGKDAVLVQKFVPPEEREDEQEQAEDVA